MESTALSLLFLLLLRLTAVTRSYNCIHGTVKNELITGVVLPDSGHVKRDTEQPMRFHTYPDSTISSGSNIMEEIVPQVLNFLSNTLSVIPTTGPILLDRNCSEGSFSRRNGVRGCKGSCVPTRCGTVLVPDSHLKRCEECNDAGTICNAGDPPTDGAGVDDADYLLYISANQTACPDGADTTVVAFAGACQMESTMDRPVAGYINFCPTSLEGKADHLLFDIAKHEMLHALAFSSDLFPFWRDASGQPRTPREADGRPPFDETTRTYETSTSTVTTTTYPQWSTRSGPVDHEVTVLVTEAVVREGRAHFGCPSLVGVELEQQGGSGSALQHWEKRAMGNEAMTAVFTYDPVFSNLSLAVMEDSGWYTVDYSAGERLLWGSEGGCEFVTEGCGDLVDEPNKPGNPYCNVQERSNLYGCTLGRGAVATCNLVSFMTDLNEDFQYFDSAKEGGRLQSADFCPFYRDFERSGLGTNCSDRGNQVDLRNNVRGETYGAGSRCVGQGRQWRRIAGSTTFSSNRYGGGCYQYECSPQDGVTIFVMGVAFKCNCEGEEHIVDIATSSGCFEGSIICPSCADICYDQPEKCPDTEPATCYGREVASAPRVGECVGSADGPGISVALVAVVAVVTLLVNHYAAN